MYIRDVLQLLSKNYRINGRNYTYLNQAYSLQLPLNFQCINISMKDTHNHYLSILQLIITGS